jgi:HEAT repeat protein
MPVTKDQVLAVVRLIEPDPAAAAKLGPDALPHLRALIRGDDISVARRAASVATKIHDPRAVRVVSLAAANEHPEVRLAAAAELWRLAEFDVGRPAARLLADLDPAVRRRVLRSLAHIGPASLKPALTRRVRVIAARDPHPANRALASVLAQRAAGEVSAADVRAALTADLPVRELGPALGKAALPHLAALARDRGAEVAAKAVALAATLSPRHATPIAELAATDRRPKVRAAAASVAGRVPGGQELLRALLGDGNARVRETALVTSARSRLPGLREITTRLAETDPDARVRALAAEYLSGPRTTRPGRPIQP